MFVSSDYPPRTGGLDVDGFRLLVIKVPYEKLDQNKDGEGQGAEREG
jgi:hypothetical protein